MLHKFISEEAGAIGKVVVFKPTLFEMSRGVCGPIVTHKSCVLADTVFVADVFAWPCVDSEAQAAKVKQAAARGINTFI